MLQIVKKLERNKHSRFNKSKTFLMKHTGKNFRTEEKMNSITLKFACT